MQLTTKDIKKINLLAPNSWQINEQGVFLQPYGVPVHIKEYVIYMRWSSGGISGGSCWDYCNPQSYRNEGSKPIFGVLDLVLKELAPNISYLHFREIEKLIHSNSETEYEYYGNRIDFEIEYIILSELIHTLLKNGYED